jgi:hypothetical protein
MLRFLFQDVRGWAILSLLAFAAILGLVMLQDAHNNALALRVWSGAGS